MRITARAISTISLLIVVGAILVLSKQDWGLLSLEIIFIALGFFYWLCEKKPFSAKYLSVIAALSSIAAVSRVPFAAIPGVQPTTFLIISTGLIFGPQAGFLAGSTAAVLSNFFLGQGPWTPWQMFAWGMAGSAAGLLKNIHPKIGLKGIVLFNFFWGYLFGWIMNLWSWTAFISPLNLSSLITVNAASFWFDTFHALGNAVFCLVFNTSLAKILRHFQRKLEISEIVNE
ncbi:MAG: ECF transporter S component [Eubacteriales bacterium]|jgi:energy-coupling factor transport system substrate-specific component